MSSSSDSDVSYYNNDSFIWTSNDNEILEVMDEDDIAIFQMMATIISNSNEFFLSHEMEEEMGQSMNPNVGAWDVLITMWATPAIFKKIDQLYNGRVWWIGIFGGVYNHRPCTIYMWVFYSIFWLGIGRVYFRVKVRVLDLISNCNFIWPIRFSV